MPESRAGRRSCHGMLRLDAAFTLRQVVVYPGEDGYWVAECPNLPGCVSQGKTKAQALENIKDAIDGYIAALKEGPG